MGNNETGISLQKINMKSKILKLIDFEKVGILLEGFNRTTGFVTAIIDLEGNVLSNSGWRRICTEFHRINPETAQKCRISDTELANKMADGEKFHSYKCLNGLVDVAVPLVIRGEHIANIFSGQFIFEESDRDFFQKQANKYGFDEKKYLEALGKVPVVSKEKVKVAMDFLLNMTRLISEMTYQKLEQTELYNELEERENQYRNLANSGLALIWTSGTDKQRNYFNDSWLKFTGRTLEQELGNGWAEGVHPDDLDRCVDIYVTAFDKREPFEMEYRLRHASGEYRVILDMGTPNYTNKSEFVGYIGHCFDITSKERLQVSANLIGEIVNRKVAEKEILILNEQLEQKIAEKTKELKERVSELERFHDVTIDRELRMKELRDEIKRLKNGHELREQEEFFRHFMEHSPVYVFFKDENIRPVKLSRNYEQMLNLPLDEMLGKSMDELFPSDLAKAMIADDQKILAGGKTITVDEELNGRHYTTIKFPFVVDGNQRYLAGYTIDITERKKAEDELIELKNKLEAKVEDRTKELNKQIQKLDKSQKAMLYMVEDLNKLTAELQEEQRKLLISNQELEAFTYSVSHDLRAPLRHINGYVDLLNEKFRADLPEKAQHYLTTAKNASEQMGRLIDDLLQLSRTGRQEVRKTKIEMNALVKEALETIKQDVEKREITWKEQELPQVFGDYSLLKQVWVNLLDNAVKYTRDTKKAEISIGVNEEEKDFIFFIRDNGVGFNMKYANKLFGVFQRLHSQTEFEGTGIGLANVQRIIHKHNGRVWADAESGKGAVFYFSLPKSP
jgi:PAS domain S-box-containing protein